MRALAVLAVLAACGAEEPPATDASLPAVDATTDATAATDALAPDAHHHPGDAAASSPDANVTIADATAPTDAAPVAITTVPCAGASIAITIYTAKSDYSPEQASIRAGQIVRFQPLNPHDVVAGTYAAPEPWFAVQGNTIGCVRFDEPGTFPFFCTAHPFSMNGAVLVAP